MIVISVQDIWAVSSSLPLFRKHHRLNNLRGDPHHLSTVIQPVRLPGQKEPTGLHLLTMVAHQTAVKANELAYERVQEGHVEIYEETSSIIYPVITGVSAEKVKQLIDAFLKEGSSVICRAIIRRRSNLYL